MRRIYRFSIALQLLVQKFRKQHFLNEFIQIFRQCYNIGIIEQVILIVDLKMAFLFKPKQYKSAL